MEKINRIGIFGGTFNPIHLGHVNGVLTVMQKQKLFTIYVVPNRTNPLKPQLEGPNPEQRLEMARLAFAGVPYVIVDDCETQRSAPSYTIDTLHLFRERHPNAHMSLIIGADSLENFDQWKDFAQILEMADLLVTTRPGSHLPASVDEMCPGLQSLTAAFDGNYAQLKTGRHMEFVQLEDVDVSATEIRQRLKTRRTTTNLLPISVANYINEHHLYQGPALKIGDFDKFTRFCANILFGRKALQVRGYDLRGMNGPSEYALVASGTSTRHASSLAENVLRAVKEEFGVFPQSLEGQHEGRWVLLDYGSLIIHVFYDFVRQEYRLEELWRESQDMNLVDPTPPVPSTGPGFSS